MTRVLFAERADAVLRGERTVGSASAGSATVSREGDGQALGDTAGFDSTGPHSAGPHSAGPHSTGSDSAELLRAIHDEHGAALWSYVVGLTNGDRAHAQDVVQETMLRAWRNPRVLVQTTGSARGWLFTVAKRIVIDDWRAARTRRERVSANVPEQAVDDTSEHAVNRQVVGAALRTLSVEHRAVLHECYFRGSSVAQASRALGIPPGTVKSRTHYALRALRLALDELGETAVPDD